MLSSIISIILSIIMLAVLFIDWILLETTRKQLNLIRNSCKINSEAVYRLFLLVDFLQPQICNPLLSAVYQKLRTSKFENLPQGEKSRDFIREAVEEYQKKIWVELKKKMETSTDPEEKKFYEKQLEKLGEVANLVSLVDNNSSPDYVRIIAEEIKKALTEENDNA